MSAPPLVNLIFQLSQCLQLLKPATQILFLKSMYCMDHIDTSCMHHNLARPKKKTTTEPDPMILFPFRKIHLKCK